jgi:hypothetical protein
MRNWQDPDSDARLMIQPRDEVYPGCLVQIKIAVHKAWSEDNPHGRWRFWVTDIDTVESMSGAIVEFVWPDDIDGATEVE